MQPTLPLFESADHLLLSVAKSLSITNTELASLQDQISECASWLKSTTPELIEVQVIGSLSRGTRLPRSIDASADVDFLLGIPTSIRSSEDVEARVQLRDRVRSRLRQAPGFAAEDSQCFFTLIRGGERYELVLVDAFGEESPRSYSIQRVNSKWELDHTGDDSPGFSSVKPESAREDVGSSSVFIKPWHLNGYLDEFDRVYDEWWRYFVLLWKYWNVLSGKPVRSYVIERNVFKGLGNASIFRPHIGTSLLGFVAFFFGNRDVYEYDRFNDIQSFRVFRDAIITAARASVGRSSVAIKDLQSVLSISRLGERFDKFDHEAARKPGPETWHEAHRLLWLKAPESSGELKTMYRKLRFWKHVDPQGHFIAHHLSDADLRSRLETLDMLTGFYEANCGGDEPEYAGEFIMMQCTCGHTLILKEGALANMQRGRMRCIECGLEIKNDETNTLFTRECGSCGIYLVITGVKIIRCAKCGMESSLSFSEPAW